MSPKRYRRDDWAVFTAVGAAYVVVPLRRNGGMLEDNVLLLEETAARLWELLAEVRSSTELEETLLREYQAEPEQLRGDLHRFLGQLERLLAAEVVV
ncbi:MAG: PqqD family protein [Armatimonadetes bacterium]|nr:PqqD family protein [Armatimonadota bacterium]